MNAKAKESQQIKEDFGKVTAPGTFRIERLLPGPVGRVWEYLVDSEKRAKWFASGKMELKVGSNFELFFLHSLLSHEKEYPEKFKPFEKGVSIPCRLTQCKPPRLLAFVGTSEPLDKAETIFELFARGKDTLLVITNTGLTKRENLVGNGAGWHAHLGILIDVLDGDKPRGFWTYHAKLEKEYENRIPKIN
jgi:uncharacterized protein YndB with AHSA1/START domain